MHLFRDNELNCALLIVYLFSLLLLLLFLFVIIIGFAAVVDATRQTFAVCLATPYIVEIIFTILYARRAGKRHAEKATHSLNNKISRRYYTCDAPSLSIVRRHTM